MQTTDYTERFPFGRIVEDRLTETEGIVVGHAEHITGCDRIAVRPQKTQYMDDEIWAYPDQLTPTENVAVEDLERPELSTQDHGGPALELGVVAEDDLTGFEGYATTITYPAFNTSQVALTPTNGDCDREWFDAPRLETKRTGVRDDYDDLFDGEAGTTETGAIGEGRMGSSCGDL